MASVNAQSVEDYADRIVYRYPAARFAQATTTIVLGLTPGLKALVNSATTSEFIIPASNESAKFFKIDWFFNVAFQSVNVSSGSIFNQKISFLEISVTSLNYDGKNLTTSFFEERESVILSSPQLRQINIGNISVDPLQLSTDWINYHPLSTTTLSLGANAFLLAAVRPVVTRYKK